MTLVRQVSKQRSQLEALSAQRLEWLGLAAHDLRGPLQGLGLMLDFLQSDLDGKVDLRQAQLLLRSQRAVTRLTSLVDDFVDVSAVEQGKVTLSKARIAVDEVVRDRMEAAQYVAERRGVRLRLVCGANPEPIVSDPTRLGQIVENLLSNAIRVSEEGGEVRLRVSRGQGGVSISVEDDGPGLDEASVRSIFEPFVRHVAGIGHSGGLGLAIVHRLTDALGGRISVESAPGEGAAFVVWLPQESA